MRNRDIVHAFGLATIAVLSLSMSTAQADLIEFTSTFVLTNQSDVGDPALNTATSGSATIGDRNTETLTVGLTQFDTSLGTLNAVAISFASLHTLQLYGAAEDPNIESRTRRECEIFGLFDCTNNTYTYPNYTSIDGNSRTALSIRLATTGSDGSVNVTSGEQLYNSYDYGCSDDDPGGLSPGTGSPTTVTRCEYNNRGQNHYSVPFAGVLSIDDLELFGFIGSSTPVVELVNFRSLSAVCDTTVFSGRVGPSGYVDSCYTYSRHYWFGDVTVSYDYTSNLDSPTTDVPEPSTLALLAAGLFGLVAFRKRRLTV
jgi:hypothetical protein